MRSTSCGIPTSFVGSSSARISRLGRPSRLLLLAALVPPFPDPRIGRQRLAGDIAQGLKHPAAGVGIERASSAAEVIEQTRAVYYGHYEIAKLLLERGAFPNPPVESSGRQTAVLRGWSSPDQRDSTAARRARNVVPNTVGPARTSARFNSSRTRMVWRAWNVPASINDRQHSAISRFSSALRAGT